MSGGGRGGGGGGPSVPAVGSAVAGWAVAGATRHRLLAFVALQTAAVAVLWSVAAALLRFDPVGVQRYSLAAGPSGPAAVATMAVVRVAGPATGGLAVLAAVAVGWHLTARAVTAREAADAPTASPLPTPLAVAVVAALLAVGAALGPGVPAGPTGGLVEETTADPTTAWHYDHEPAGDGRGLLTVTFAAGQSVWADHLSVRGSGFAAVPGADVTEPGPWSGAATGGTLSVGDSVTVGVRGDCRLRLVYEFGERVETIGRHECGGRRGDAGVGELRPGGGP